MSSAFQRLDLQVLSYVDPRPIAVHQKMKDAGEEKIRSMPLNFKTPEEARSYWLVVNSRSHHFLAAIDQETRSSESDMYIDPGMPDVSPYSTKFTAQANILSDLSGEIVNKGGRYVAEVDRWFKAFDPLYESLEAKRGSWKWMAASLLKIDAMTTKILLKSLWFSDQDG
jgi:hypothetical protein